MSGLDNSQEVTDEVSKHAKDAGESNDGAEQTFTDAPPGSSADDAPDEKQPNES